MYTNAQNNVRNVTHLLNKNHFEYRLLISGLRLRFITCSSVTVVKRATRNITDSVCYLMLGFDDFGVCVCVWCVL